MFFKMYIALGILTVLFLFCKPGNTRTPSKYEKCLSPGSTCGSYKCFLPGSYCGPYDIGVCRIAACNPGETPNFDWCSGSDCLCCIAPITEKCVKPGSSCGEYGFGVCRITACNPGETENPTTNSRFWCEGADCRCCMPPITACPADTNTTQCSKQSGTCRSQCLRWEEPTWINNDWDRGSLCSKSGCTCCKSKCDSPCGNNEQCTISLHNYYLRNYVCQCNHNWAGENCEKQCSPPCYKWETCEESGSGLYCRIKKITY